MKTFIKNRKRQKLALIIDQPENPQGLAIVFHGLSGNKEQTHIKTFAQAFTETGCAAVRFDAANTYGESEGTPEDATTTNYLEDLEDVISWVKTQAFHSQPYFLAGHSLGAFAAALYAEKHPEEIKGLAPVSTVVSGKLSAQTAQYSPEVIKNWRESGWLIRESSTTPGLVKRLKWQEMEDRLKYDLIPEAYKLTMPVLMIAGENDISTPVEHQKILYEALPGRKELHVIKGAPHTFRTPTHLQEIKDILINWIKSSN